MLHDALRQLVRHDALRQQVRQCQHALQHLRTKDELAVRRCGDEEDPDLWLLSCGSPYAVDAHQKILPSRALRRLADKTQVITGDYNRHIRTRAVHTYEVVDVATTIAQILGLHRDLCQAIAFGHDLGHTPFGHLGEKILTLVTGKPFRHEVFGLVVAQHIERHGYGLNLTRQVLEGMLYHSRGTGELVTVPNITPEANVVMYADKIAYIWADFNDIFNRMGQKLSDYPELQKQAYWFGENQRERVATCVASLCLESANKGSVAFSASEVAQRFAEVKQLMYKHIYPLVNFDTTHGDTLLYHLYDFLKGVGAEGVDPAILFALLTDHEALALASKFHLKPEDLQSLSIAEIIPYLQGKDIKFDDPDLNWGLTTQP